MKSEILRYSADSRNMESHLFIPDDAIGRRPGVVVYPDMYGLGAHTRERAERLAALGYVALACDLHGGGHILKDFDEVMAVRETLIHDPKAIRARAKGGLQALWDRIEVDTNNLAAIGFCFGGRMSLELARSGEELKGVVAFHAGLRSSAVKEARHIKGRVLVCTGVDDPMATAEDRAAFEKEMNEGEVDWQIHLYGGVRHGFTMPEADAMGRPDIARYDRKADARSWRAMLNFFDEIFTDPPPENVDGVKPLCVQPPRG